MRTENPQPILCGTDFSENAGQAATAAASLAAMSRKPMILVHVADEFNARGQDRKALAELLRPLRNQLNGEAERLRKTGASVATRLVIGSLAEHGIKALGEKVSAALVVVSSNHKKTIDRWTLGSVSEYLAQADPVPTLVVRSAAPFEAWARGERPLKVFVGADLAVTSEAALKWVRELCGFGRCEITVAHVYRLEKECERLGIAPSVGENPPAVERVLERDLRGEIRAQLGEVDARVVVEPVAGHPEARLIELAAEAQADLLVVGTHQRRGLWRVGHASVSRNVLRHAPMGVACIPPASCELEGTRIAPIRRVLVAVDFSDLGNRNVLHGYQLLREGGIVRLVHNIQPFVPPLVTSGGLGQEVSASSEHGQVVAGLQAKLRALAPPDAEDRGIVTEVEITESRKTAEAICAAAERFAAEMVCIGSHTRPGFAANVLGSVSLAVLKSCRRPVLVTWPPTE